MGWDTFGTKMVQSHPLNRGGVKMYLIYKRADGVVEDLVYRQVGNTVQVATGGDFRRGYISFSKKKFEKIFLSKAISKSSSKNKIS